MLGTVVVNIGSFSLGTALAWPAPALLQLAKEHGLSEGQVGLTGEEQSWVASLMHPGGFAAVLLAGPLMDRFGKKVRWQCIAMGRGVTLLASIQCNRLLAGDHDAALPAHVPRMALHCRRSRS